MGQSGSREGQILYAAVIGNTSAIRELVSRGTSVNCVDSQGRTPLILASGQAEGFEAAKLLLQMGALVRAYSKGPGGGMAIHYAARKKLDAMVKLLLDHGADPLFPNDDRKTALDLARERNETSVVRLIESRVALFEGYVRQQTLSALSLVKEFRIWVAVLPGPTMSDGRQTFRLALYRSMAFGVPYFNIALHVCRIHMTKLDSANPVLVIEDPVHGNNGKLKLVSDLDSPDPLQIFRLHDACRGTPRILRLLRRLKRPLPDIAPALHLPRNATGDSSLPSPPSIPSFFPPNNPSSSHSSFFSHSSLISHATLPLTLSTLSLFPPSHSFHPLTLPPSHTFLIFTLSCLSLFPPSHSSLPLTPFHLSLFPPSHSYHPLTLPSLSLFPPSHSSLPLTLPSLSLFPPSHSSLPLTPPSLSLFPPSHSSLPLNLTSLSLFPPSLFPPSHSFLPSLLTLLLHAARVVNVHAWQDDVDEDTAFQLALSESMRTASIASSARADAPGASGSTSTAAQGMSRGEEGADGFILTYSSSEPQPRSGRSLSSSSSAAAAVPFTALHRSSRSVSASADRHPFVPPAAPIPSSSAAAGTSSGVAAGPAAGTAAGSASTAGTAGFAAAGAEGGRMRDEIANQFSSVAPALNRAPAAAVSSLFASGPPSAPPVDAPASAAAGPHSSTPAAPAAAPAGAGAGTGAGAGAGEEAGAAATGAEVGAEAKAGVATTVGAPSSSSAAAAAAAAAGASKEGRCVICWDSAALSVCVPCGHVAGCVECLTKVRSKGWGCPVCRAPIREVVKIFHV
ncbi:unnamed protein product [Closterium sp. NIES-65]|nr:unnamed protein product [Closterium sp. NIES-65]